MTDEKGYIQFECVWTLAPPSDEDEVKELLACRNRLFARGLIGVYPNGIGYGNVSACTGQLPEFLITGTATGALELLQPEHVTRVTAYDIAANRVWCRGPLQASSESMSHAAVYEAEPRARAVIHVHHLGLWEHLRGRIATTDVNAEAGTPAMADAIKALFRASSPPGGLFAMGGHREGITSYGETFIEAEEKLIHALRAHDSA